AKLSTAVISYAVTFDGYLPNTYHAAIPKSGPLASCITKTTENSKNPERPMLSGFPGIDTKTAPQIGRLFLY
ncbi:MAG: hypothetical protein ACLTTF_07030, partial [Oscillospiraceae bacterium]